MANSQRYAQAEQEFLDWPNSALIIARLYRAKAQTEPAGC